MTIAIKKDPNAQDPATVPGQDPNAVPQPAIPGAPPRPVKPPIAVAPPRAPQIPGSVVKAASTTPVNDTGVRGDGGAGGTAATPGAAPLPTQLADGNGGAIAVPAAPISSVALAPGGPATITGANSPAAAPPAAPAPGPDTGGGAPTSQFGPDGNLINTQINPTADKRTMDLQGMQDATLQKMVNGPDRNQMAKDQYNTWQAETAPDFAHSITDATDAAAAHGQIQSGQLTNRYGDLAQQRVLDQTTARNKYMQQALSDSIGDTRANVAATASAAGTAYDQGAAGRSELRGERGYQAGQSEQALLNRIRQQQAEAAAQQVSYGQGANNYAAGNTGDPTGAYENAQAGAQSEAAGSSADTQALLKLLAQRRGRVPTAVA